VSIRGTLPAPTPGVDEPWTLTPGPGPLVGVAIHAGHEMRPEIRRLTKLSDAERRHEEDPFTESFAALIEPRLVAHRSRFEVDLNRDQAGAVYLEPEQSWGLDVWSRRPDARVVERSRSLHRDFYQTLGAVLDDLVVRHGSFVVYDFHSYNHRRQGAGAPPAPVAENPQINLGTGTMDRSRWGPICDAFLAAVRAHRLRGAPIDARENVRFLGGYLPRWVHANYPKAGCALAIEVKKSFMDEWTGEHDSATLEDLRAAIRASLPAVTEALELLGEESA
jgi:N-formylglutamate amidohydrolase